MIENLRELRLRAGLTQGELACKSGISEVTIWGIEKGKHKPRDLTWRKLIKALPAAQAETEESKEESVASDYLGQILGKDEFFSKLREKMSDSLFGVLDQSYIMRLIEAAEFFSRQRFYPGDFATAVELLGELQREWRRQGREDGERANRKKRPYTKRKNTKACEESKIKFGNPGRWPKRK